MSETRDPYRAIMIAAARGRGLRLTAREALALAQDDAIFYRAQHTLSPSESERMYETGKGWRAVSAFAPTPPHAAAEQVKKLKTPMQRRLCGYDCQARKAPTHD